MSKKTNPFVDYYELLQVHPKASDEVINKAHKTLMLKNHPDKGGSEEVAKKLNKAKDVLIDSKVRKEYDIIRAQYILSKVKSIKNEKAKQFITEKKKVFNLKSNDCPMINNQGVIVSDQRGSRIIILDSNGENIWEFSNSKNKINYKLDNPEFSCFSGNNILITDTGNSRVIEVNQKKDIEWQFGTGIPENDELSLNNPKSALKLKNGNYLISDTNNKRVIEVNKLDQIVWQYGDLNNSKMFGKTFLSLGSKSLYSMFHPVYAERLENNNTLISDMGNRRLIEVSPDRKIVWQYPNKKMDKNGMTEFVGANFCHRQKNGSTIYTMKKVNEVDGSGNLIWHYKRKVSDIDINWSYKIDNKVLVNLTRVVRRGVNQEIMLVDSKGKVIWRYYYSQYKSV